MQRQKRTETVTYCSGTTKPSVSQSRLTAQNFLPALRVWCVVARFAYSFDRIAPRPAKGGCVASLRSPPPHSKRWLMSSQSFRFSCGTLLPLLLHALFFHLPLLATLLAQGENPRHACELLVPHSQQVCPVFYASPVTIVYSSNESFPPPQPPPTNRHPQTAM